MKDHYDYYSEEDFLLDESFVQYCLGTDAVVTRYWNNWLELHPEKRAVFNQAVELYYALNGNNDRAQYQRHEQVFRERLQQAGRTAAGNSATVQQPRPANVLRRKILLTGAALGLACLFMALLFKKQTSERQPGNGTDYSSATGYGERKLIRLDDGTSVTLNAGTRLTVLPGFNTATREILLDGEALLDVTHNPQKPFIIHTATMDVRVLGTLLNIKDYRKDKKAETSLIRGLVEVVLKGQGNVGKITLHPSQKIVVSQPVDESGAAAAKKTGEPPVYAIRQLEPPAEDSTVNEILWTKSRLVFEDESLEEIALVLERYYAVEIELSDEVKGNRYRGTFESKRIEDVLNALQLSQPFEYSITRNRYIRISHTKN